MMDSSNKEEIHQSHESNLINLEESYTIPSLPNNVVMDGSQESEEDDFHDFLLDRNNIPNWNDNVTTDLCATSDDSVISDEWQELNKSDYAKVIFCDLYYQTDSGSVGCKFQITDNVHEDPCDSVGLFRIGFESLNHCLISKMLSETDCEEDGKLLRCDFSSEELPDIEAGFYQFLYITRDKEICGASMPFEIKQSQVQPRDFSPDCITTEKCDDDFLLVRHGLEKKNQMLEELLAESQEKTRELNLAIETLTHEKDDILKEKEVVIDALQKAMSALKDELALKVSEVNVTNNAINSLSEQIPALSREVSVKELLLSEKDNIIKSMSKQIEKLLIKEREALGLQSENDFLRNKLQGLSKVVELSTYDQNELTLMEQLDYQKFMIRALEDSKQLAMNNLSESLTERIKTMHQMNAELYICKAKVKDLTEALDKRTEELEETSVELAAYKILNDTPVSEIQASEQLAVVKNELAQFERQLKLSLVSEGKMSKELEKSKAEFSDCKKKLEYSVQDANQLCEVVHTLKIELERKHKEADELIKTWKVETAVSEERLKVMHQVVRECEELRNEMKSKSFSKDGDISTYYLLQQAYCKKKCELLAFTGKVKHLLMVLEKVKEVGHEDSPLKGGPCKVTKKCLKKIENLDNVDAKDIAFINNLTERINRRESGCLLQVESAAPGSEINTVLKDAMLCVERIINAVKCPLWITKDWSKVVDGYDGEYADLPIELQIELLLAECRSQYQIEILLQHAGKNDSQKLISEMLDLQWKNSVVAKEVDDLTTECAKLRLSFTEKETEVARLVSEMSGLRSKSSISDAEVNDLKKQCADLNMTVSEKDAQISKLSDQLFGIQSKCMLVEEDHQELKCSIHELKVDLYGSRSECSKLKDECKKKDGIIEFLKTEKCDLSSKQTDLQDVVKEHTARLTEAAGLYKKQYKEIEKLKKELKEIKEPQQISAPAEVSDPPVVVLNDESKTSSPVHEIFYPARSSSDSDTGEHVSGDGAFKEVKEKSTKAAKISVKQNNDEKALEFKNALTRTKRLPSRNSESRSSLFNNYTLPLDGCAKWGPHKVEVFNIPCPACNKEIEISSKSTEALTNHLETQHHMSMCPICGHFFEESVPKKYLTYHIEGHFQKNEIASNK